MTAARAQPVLLHTPFHALHVELGARMVAFAGYDMPVQYPAGIMKEHLHVRAAAGLFDISHMGQFAIHPKNGSIEHAAEALEALVPADVIGLAVGRQRYALLTNEQGGVRDDLMIANLGDRFLVVANAACKDADEAYLRRSLAERCDVETLDDRALLALQGPASQQVLAAIGANVVPMRFLDVKVVKLLDTDCIVCRSGYTGEDGFEISVPSSMAEPLARKLLADAHVIPVGLGARDSLRLEAGLCLYGSDLDEATTPVEAALEWSIGRSRRDGGGRAGGFPGAAVILSQLKTGVARRRVGLRPEGRAPIRHGAPLFTENDPGAAVGVVTSGGFGPSVNAPIAMGYVATSAATSNAPLFAELRGAKVPVRICKLPFVTPTYKR